MLASSTWASQSSGFLPFQPFRSFAPKQSSPLSPRSTNIMSAQPQFSTRKHDNTDAKPVPYSKRVIKANPLLQTRDQATQRRRELFQRRVQNNREEKRWEGRGEQIQRMDFFSEQRRWEQAKAREANKFIPDQELPEENASMEYDDEQDFAMEEEMEANHMLELERQELEALVSSQQELERDNASQHYGSDDEDYDKLFMECLDEVEGSALHGQPRRYEDPDAMDMS